MIEILRTNFEHSDNRGRLVQITRDGYKQVNYVVSQKGSVRGMHYHKINTELFYVISGDFFLYLRKDDVSKTFRFKEGDLFRILPGVIHTFEYLEDTQLIGMYDLGVEMSDGSMDMYMGDCYEE